MAYTPITIKYSTANSTPTTLNVAEPAYSYTSNTLFIGTEGSNGYLAIGGQFYVNQQGQIFDKANAAFNAANTGTGAAAAGSYANSGFATANSASNYANAAFAVANNSTDLWVRTQANSAFNQANAAFLQANTPSNVANSAASYANAAFIAANTKLSLSGGTITGPISGLGNSKLDFTTYGSNTAYLTTTDDDSTALFMGAVTAELYANTSVSIRANTKGTSQTWTFDIMSSSCRSVNSPMFIPYRLTLKNSCAKVCGHKERKLMSSCTKSANFKNSGMSYIADLCKNTSDGLPLFGLTYSFGFFSTVSQVCIFLGMLNSPHRAVFLVQGEPYSYG